MFRRFDLDGLTELSCRLEDKAAECAALLNIAVEIAQFAVIGRDKPIRFDEVARISCAHVGCNDLRRFLQRIAVLGRIPVSQQAQKSER